MPELVLRHRLLLDQQGLGHTLDGDDQARRGLFLVVISVAPSPQRPPQLSILTGAATFWSRYGGGNFVECHRVYTRDFRWMGHRMFGADDYIVLAELCSQLALTCSTPTLSLALMRLASDYLAQSHRQSAAGEQALHPQPDPIGFGD